MKKTSILFVCMIALVVFAAWAPNADANPSTSSCVGCHKFGGSGSTMHTGHLGLGLPQSCNTCHEQSEDTPPTQNCGVCHVDPGTPLHHTNRGISDVNGLSCVMCHPGTPDPENTAVFGYEGLAVALDPCNGSEERHSSRTVSLDNDGDLLYDMDDPDCQPAVEICNNGIDDDGDGQADCADLDCDGFTNGAACTTDQPGICARGTEECQNLAVACVQNQSPVAEQPPGSTVCRDGLDNDCDGNADATDADCVFPPETNCFDDNDDNGDGLVDCADSTCAGAIGPTTNCGTGECAATGNWTCFNGTRTDTCQAGKAASEGPFFDVTCSDGQDNDCDGSTDTDDPNCNVVAEADCFDGDDNNGDGQTDCADSTCTNVSGPETSCGVGACAATGNLTCFNGARTDTCQAGKAASEGPFFDDTCSDGLDNDCDGSTDASDLDSCTVTAEGNCFDGHDNNGDGLTDCEDPTCANVLGSETRCGAGACAATGNRVCAGGVETNTCQAGNAGTEGLFGDPTCSDTVDNDCDGDVDAADADCVGEEVCNNGGDDDGDNLADCADPDCTGATNGACVTGIPGICGAGTLTCQGLEQVCLQDQKPVAEQPPGSEVCQDGVDNDCDGFTDGDDAEGCVFPPENNCFDGIDNNGDGMADCADSTCATAVGQMTTCGVGVCAATGNRACSNGQKIDTCQAGAPGKEGPFGDETCADTVDNDCDGATDGGDPECIEDVVAEICDDGQDNDGDGLVDCDDTADCANGSACRVVAEICDDGLDNDSDGLFDCDDTADCANDPACAEVPAPDIVDAEVEVDEEVKRGKLEVEIEFDEVVKIETLLCGPEGGSLVSAMIKEVEFEHYETEVEAYIAISDDLCGNTTRVVCEGFLADNRPFMGTSDEVKIRCEGDDHEYDEHDERDGHDGHDERDDDWRAKIREWLKWLSERD